MKSPGLPSPKIDMDEFLHPENRNRRGTAKDLKHLLKLGTRVCLRPDEKIAFVAVIDNTGCRFRFRRGDALDDNERELAWGYDGEIEILPDDQGDKK